MFGAMATTLLLDQLRAVLAYCPLSGVFRWTVSRGRVRAGSVAGSPDPDTGYWRIRVFGRLLYGHRLAWAFVTGEWPAEEIDHRDCDRTNNCFGNLRAAGECGNKQNTSLGKNNTSGLKGAFFYKRDNCWVSEITANHQRVYLGRFGSKEQAHEAYVRASKALHGEFARAA